MQYAAYTLTLDHSATHAVRCTFIRRKYTCRFLKPLLHVFACQMFALAPALLTV